MEFNYKTYEYMLNLLKNNNYEVTNYEKHINYDKCVILRHDIDTSLNDAVKLANLEFENGVKSTYFILLSTDFYNIFSKKSRYLINEIKSMGHEIGLHFDEVKYDINNEDDIKKYIDKEINIMSQELEMDIYTVSMHRPSKWVLDKNIKFNNIINSYGKEFFEEFKYLSDSRMNWREDVLEIIKSNRYDKLHILTHAFWYKDDPIQAKNILLKFINQRKMECYLSLKANIRDLDEIIKEEEVLAEEVIN